MIVFTGVTPTLTLSGTFFCVITTAQSAPLIPMLVMAPSLIALNAYSKKKKEKRWEHEVILHNVKV